MCIEQTSDGMAEMGAALYAVQRRDAQWNSSEPPRLARAKLRYAAEQLRSAAARLCSAMEKLGKGFAPLRPERAQHEMSLEWLWKRTASTGDGGAKKGVGIAGICPALRGISGQRTCIGAEKRGAKKQVHREAKASIRRATELHCCAYAKALKGDALHRHRGAVTRRAREMSSIDKRGVSLAEKRFGIA